LINHDHRSINGAVGTEDKKQQMELTVTKLAIVDYTVKKTKINIAKDIT
jgi:hypothetical protein